MTVIFTIIANIACDENGVKLVDNLRSFSADDEAFLADCRRRADLGAAIRQHEAERLVEMLTGEPIKRRKRCERCGGTGMYFGDVLIDKCNACHGTGYEGTKQ